jgi:hypothetical protein
MEGLSNSTLNQRSKRTRRENSLFDGFVDDRIFDEWSESEEEEEMEIATSKYQLHVLFVV